MKANFKNILLLLLLVVSVLLAVTFISGAINKDEEIKYSQIIEMFKDDIVVSFEVDDSLNLSLTTLTPKRNEDSSYVRDEFGNIVFEMKDGQYVYSTVNLKANIKSAFLDFSRNLL